MNVPIVTVILTTYNSEKILQRTLDSIFSQEGLNSTFKMELLVIDDGSSDFTPKILEQNHVSFIRLESNSGGPNRGRNIGLDKATGDYICIMDHDDEWHSNRLASLLAARHIAPLISSGLTLVEDNGRKRIDRMNRANNSTGWLFYETNVTFLKTLARSTNGQNCYLGSVLFHKTLNTHRFEEHFGKMDFDWGLKLMKDTSSVEVCSTLYNRHISENNLSFNEIYRSQDFFYSLMVLDRYREDFPNETKQGIRRLYGTRARFYYLNKDMRRARYHFLRAGITPINMLYYLSTFIGSKIIKKRFRIFG